MDGSFGFSVIVRNLCGLEFFFWELFWGVGFR